MPVNPGEEDHPSYLSSDEYIHSGASQQPASQPHEKPGSAPCLEQITEKSEELQPLAGRAPAAAGRASSSANNATHSRLRPDQRLKPLAALAPNGSVVDGGREGNGNPRDSGWGQQSQLDARDVAASADSNPADSNPADAKDLVKLQKSKRKSNRRLTPADSNTPATPDGNNSRSKPAACRNLESPSSLVAAGRRGPTLAVSEKARRAFVPHRLH